MSLYENPAGAYRPRVRRHPPYESLVGARRLKVRLGPFVDMKFRVEPKLKV